MAKAHSFDTEHAARYGLVEAILISALEWWVEHNQGNQHNQRDGRTWVYNSYRAWSEVFGYLTPAQIRRALGSLERQGVILREQYGAEKGDMSNWYAFVNEAEFCRRSSKPQKPAQEAPERPEKARGASAKTDRCHLSGLADGLSGIANAYKEQLSVPVGSSHDCYRKEEPGSHDRTESAAVTDEERVSDVSGKQTVLTGSDCSTNQSQVRPQRSDSQKCGDGPRGCARSTSAPLNLAERDQPREVTPPSSIAPTEGAKTSAAPDLLPDGTRRLPAAAAEALDTLLGQMTHALAANAETLRWIREVYWAGVSMDEFRVVCEDHLAYFRRVKQTPDFLPDSFGFYRAPLKKLAESKAPKAGTPAITTTTASDSAAPVEIRGTITGEAAERLLARALAEREAMFAQGPVKTRVEVRP